MSSSEDIRSDGGDEWGGGIGDQIHVTRDTKNILEKELIRKKRFSFKIRSNKSK